jgi:hypothetical protein
MTERLLRTYERVAHQEHFCDRCCEPIHLGEMYEGRVTVYANNLETDLVVIKTHIHPSCDFPQDPDEERTSIKKESRVSLKKAA